MKVLKFGGTSVGSREGLKNILALATDSTTSSPTVIVVSAISGCTDSLIETARRAERNDPSYSAALTRLLGRHRDLFLPLLDEPAKAAANAILGGYEAELKDLLHGVVLLRDLSPRTLDSLMSFGERISADLVTLFLRSGGLTPVELVDAREVVKTSAVFGNARVLQSETRELIRARLGTAPGTSVVTGFLGSTLKGETTTLGRGGSDLTASIFGAALGAEEIQIWTDVSGVLTADPRKVPGAFSIPLITYQEAMELSHFGAKVIYAPTIQPALDAKIPLLIKNSFQPQHPGTRVVSEREPSEHPVTGVTSMQDVALLRLQGSGLIGVTGTAKRFFEALSRRNINVILISQASSEYSICIAVRTAHGEAACEALEEEFRLEIASHMIERPALENDMCIIAVVGESMRNFPGISGTLFQSLGRNGINVVTIAQGSTERNISLVTGRGQETKALNALHDAFFLSDVKTMHLFVVGTGNIGSAFLSQLHLQTPVLEKEKHIRFAVHGLSDSKTMTVTDEPLDVEIWRTSLDRAADAADIREFVRMMKQLNLSNSIFVDCTASEAVAELYPGILSSSISVVTPNKRPYSGSYERYRAIKRTAKHSNVKVYYETTVGAGLPVLNTLADLLASGDHVVRIEAVLSGTLSFLFNTFDGTKPFSEVVREAKRLGYTEPDPRDDLSGSDVGRKLLILAREIGLELEPDAIQIQSLIPGTCGDAPSVDEFFQQLATHDVEFDVLRKSASSNGEKLCYLGKIENGEASVSLQAVNATHPFSALSGSDNMIAFFTTRYSDRPLVIKGPGAGKDVTAAGLFADVIRVASYLAER